MPNLSSFIGLVGVKKGLEVLLEIGKVDLESFDGLGDLLQALVLVGLVRAINSLLVAILLDDLATIANLVEAQGG